MINIEDLEKIKKLIGKVIKDGGNRVEKNDIKVLVAYLTAYMIGSDSFRKMFDSHIVKIGTIAENEIRKVVKELGTPRKSEKIYN